MHAGEPERHLDAQFLERPHHGLRAGHASRIVFGPVATLPTVLGQINLPGLGQEGPDDLQQLLTIFYLMLGGGFLIGIAGHMFKSRTLVIAGIVLIFGGTAVFMVAIGSYG